MKNTKSSRLVLSLLFLIILFAVTILIAQTVLGAFLAKMILYVFEALLTF